MTKLFERGILLASGGLIIVLMVLAVVKPPDAENTSPQAMLQTRPPGFNMSNSEDALEGVFHIKAVGTPNESLTNGVDVWPFEHEQKNVILYATDTLVDAFRRLDYDLSKIKAEGISVPRLFLVSLPIDISEVREVKKRKLIFFKTVLPLILQVNDEIKVDRRRLKSLISQVEKGDPLPTVDQLWLIVMAARYKVDRGDLAELLKRTDTVPPSMALAQAAEESGWGTSRFSREGNAIFGEWTFSGRQGLVPQKREAGKKHFIRAFKSLLDSVRAYTRNLNTHRAYRNFRSLRQQIRQRGKRLKGRALIETLSSYSERGMDYVKGLRAIMTVNKLDPLDAARLVQPSSRRPLI
jgi:Bax protein